jgi:hypothetical protein
VTTNPNLSPHVTSVTIWMQSLVPSQLEDTGGVPPPTAALPAGGLYQGLQKDAD